MADSTEQVAVESAATAVSAANVAQDAASHAEVVLVQTEAAATEINNETVVTAAEAAVTLAETQAAIATQEAAIVIREAEHTIVENEARESWQDEAIRELQASQQTLLTAMNQLASDLSGMREAIVELISPPSTQQQQTEAESEIPNANPTTANNDSTRTEQSPNDADGNPVQVTPEKRKRVLRFL